jgi:sugar lactone lactonase YvrE
MKIKNFVNVLFSTSKNVVFLLFTFMCSSLLQATTSYDISTIAGIGPASFSGDGGVSTSAALNGPKGLCMDSTNIYVVDAGNQRLRKFPIAGGNISTIAGTGATSFSGDGGAATAAALNSPFGICGDNSGNVFVTDATNGRIRVITAGGNISSIAGANAGTASSAQSYSGYSGDGGAATSALINSPSSVARDSSGNIYFADTSNNCVRKISGSTITTLISGLSQPKGVFVDSNNNVYVADTGNNAIKVYWAATTAGSYTTGSVYTVASTSSNISPSSPTGVWAVGNTTPASIRIYFSDATGIKQLSPSSSSGSLGTVYSVISGLSSPNGIFGVSGSTDTVYFTDTNSHAAKKLIWDYGVHSSVSLISTIAGTGSAGFSGDGGPATSATLNIPYAVCVDSANNFYVADTTNNRIRKFTASTGVFSTIAGTGPAGYNNDNIIASSAQISNPQGICIDNSNNIYFSDAGNFRIRMIAGSTFTVNSSTYAAGFIYTVAGTGVSGSTGNGGSATSAKVNSPAGICIDSSGNIYFADTGSNQVRRFTVGGNISLMAGTGASGSTGDGGAATSALLNNPWGVCLDSSGLVYVTDYGNDKIRRFTVGGNISTVAGTGTQGYSGDGAAATSAKLKNPYGICSDSSGNIYFADQGNHIIRKFTVGGNISTIAGTVPTGSGTTLHPGYTGDAAAATSATLNSPRGICIDITGNLYIADSSNSVIRKIGNTALIAGISGISGSSGDNGAATSAKLNSPSGIYYDGTSVYVADTGNSRIRKFNVSGTISTIAGTGTAGYNGTSISATTARLNNPLGVFVNGGTIYIADSSNNLVRSFALSGNITNIAGSSVALGYSGDGGIATSALLNNPNGIYIDSTTTPYTVYFTDSVNHAVRKFTWNVNTNVVGNISTIAGNGTSGSAVDGATASPTSSQLNSPKGIFLDSSRNIYIADTSNNVIRMIAGVTATIGGSTYTANNIYTIASGFNAPTGIYVDGFGTIYVADSSNNRIKSFMLGGSISTIAGGGANTSATFSGSSTGVALSNPRGLWGDSFGNIYFADQGKNVIRKLLAKLTYAVSSGSTTTMSGAASTAYVTGGGTSILPSSNSIGTVEINDGILQANTSAVTTFNASAGKSAIMQISIGGITLSSALTFSTNGSVQIDNAISAILGIAPTGTGTMGKTGPGLLRVLSALNSSTTPVSVSQGTLEVSGSGKLPNAATSVASGAILQLGTANGTVSSGAVPGSTTIASGGIISVPTNVNVPNGALSNSTFEPGAIIQLGAGSTFRQNVTVGA